ncbi:hypothetical protein ACLKA7_001743 [Drosophila subpalustris]
MADGNNNSHIILNNNNMVDGNNNSHISGHIINRRHKLRKKLRALTSVISGSPWDWREQPDTVALQRSAGTNGRGHKDEATCAECALYRPATVGQRMQDDTQPPGDQ